MGQPASLLCGSVSGECLERGLCHWLASRGLPSTWLISGHFAHSPYVTGDLPTIAIVLNPRWWVSYVLRHGGPFKWSCLKIQQFFCHPHPHRFLQPEVVGIYLPDAGTLGGAVWRGAGIAHSQGITSIFYLPHVNVGALMPILPPPLHTTPHLLAFPPYLHVSTPPPHLDECGFFKSLVVGLPYSSIFWQFWMLFVLRFHCNSFYSCIRRWSVSTYASILTGSKKCSDILNV